MIARCSEDKEICENANTSEELFEYTKNLSLNHAKGKKSSDVAEKINNITYTLTENQMGITKIRFSLNEDDGTMYYTNAQGDKEIKFGMCKNEFTEFPENGYADEIGTVPGNIRYKCASSAVWTDDDTLSVQIQIIDKYMGVLHMKFKFFE